MGRGPAQRRGPVQALGRLGSTTVASTATGGGHDPLIQRFLQQGGTEWDGPNRATIVAYSPDPVTVTGAGNFGFNEFIVDDKWDDGRPCLVTATVFYNGSYVPQEFPRADPDYPVTYYDAPALLVQLIDGSPSRETDYTEPTIEVGYGSTRLGDPASTVTVSHLFLRGRPKLQVNLTVGTERAPGITGTHKLMAVAHVLRL